MKLSVKILLLLLAATAISFSSSVSLRLAVELPALHALEAEADRKEIERVLLGLDMMRNVISILSRDYSVWDDSFNYFTTRDDAFLRTNFRLDTFISNDINVVLLADANGKVVWFKVADIENERFFPDSTWDSSTLMPYLADANSAKPGAPISSSGLINTNFGPMIYASTSVLRSDEGGISPGSVLFARFIDQTLIDEIRELVKADFTLTHLKPNEAGHRVRQELSTVRRDPNNRVTWQVNDTNDQPILDLHLQLPPRSFDNKILTLPLLIALGVMLCFWLLLSIILNRIMTQPILSIGKHLHHIRDSGDYSLRLGSDRNDEVGIVIAECDRLIETIEQQKAIMNQQAGELHQLSYEDSLTQLPNRRRFDQLLHDYWALSQRDKTPLSLLMCDIDFFKAYNDNYGHPDGDRALKAVADIFRQTMCRESDLAMRYGGEEFVIILPGTDETGATVVATRLHKNLTAAAISHEYSMVSTHLTLSVGIACICGSSGLSMEQLLDNADQALYEAKAAGRNRTEIFKPKLNV